MKLRFFSTLQAGADVLLAVMQGCQRPVQAFRVWCWHHATKANLESCNARQTARERFT